jgi:Holliday junction resolvase RusA-like endonuclease
MGNGEHIQSTSRASSTETDTDGDVKTKVSFVFDIDPVAKGRPRLSRYGVYTPKKTKDFESKLKWMAMDVFSGPPLDGPLRAEITINIKRPKSVKRKYPTCKPDIDNFQKSLFDGLNGIIIKDDSLIIECVVKKRYAGKGSIEICLQSVE